MKPTQLLGIILVCLVANSAYAQNPPHPANWNTMNAADQAAWTSIATMPRAVLRLPDFRNGERIWVLWTFFKSWAVVDHDAVGNTDGSSTANNKDINYSYFETLKDCTDVQNWMVSLPRAKWMEASIITFQCFPSEIDPRQK